MSPVISALEPSIRAATSSSHAGSSCEKTSADESAPLGWRFRNNNVNRSSHSTSSASNGIQSETTHSTHSHHTSGAMRVIDTGAPPSVDTSIQASSTAVHAGWIGQVDGKGRCDKARAGYTEDPCVVDHLQRKEPYRSMRPEPCRDDRQDEPLIIRQFREVTKCGIVDASLEKRLREGSLKSIPQEAECIPIPIVHCSIVRNVYSVEWAIVYEISRDNEGRA